MKVKVFQPISREVGEFVDLAEAAHLSSPTVELRSRVSGRIDRVDCRPGQAVKKGQVLFEIDRILLQGVAGQGPGRRSGRPRPVGSFKDPNGSGRNT